MIETQAQKPASLTPADPLGARFCQWFSHPWNFIFAPTPTLGEKPQWQTETAFPLQPRNLWQQYQNPDKLVGLRFGDETRYCLIDIDKSSPYHPANNFSGFKDVLNALEEIGLTRPLVVQSSWSGGLHVHYFFERALPTFSLACAVKFALEDAGLYLRQGELESFPNVKAFSKRTPTDYNAHRLPLQDGSYLLDDELQPLSNGVAYFLNAADVAAAHQDLTTLESAIATAIKRHKVKYIPGTSSKAAEWKRHLEERISEGWTGPGQTNELLKDFAVYGIVWQALSDTALVDHIVATALAAPGYQQYCSHQHEIQRKAQDWAQCCEGFYTPYCSYPDRKGCYKNNFTRPQADNIVEFPSNRANVERSAETHQRIGQAVQDLETLNALPSGATARARAIIAAIKAATGSGMSLSTLHRQTHLSLWHPDHYSKQGVIDCPERVSDDVDPNNQPPLETLEPSHSSLLHPVCPYEGRSASEEPEQLKTAQAPQSEPLQGGGGGENSPSAVVENPRSALSRQTTTRVRAIQQAQKAVRTEAVSRGRIFGREERMHFEQVVKFRLFWESGFPALMSEATQWAIANPDALPEALPQSDVSSQLHVAPTQTAQSNGELSVSEGELPAVEGELPKTLPLSVGDFVAHIDPFQVAYTYHGIVEQLMQGSAVVRWVERSGKSLERETYDFAELRIIDPFDWEGCLKALPNQS